MKPWLVVLVSLLLGIGIVAALTLVSASSKNKRLGNFKRIFPKEKILSLQATVDLRFNSYYLAGADSSNIYLANSTDPNQLIIADYRLRTKHVQLNIPDTARIAWKLLQVRIDFPNILITEGITPSILKGTFPSLSYSKKQFDLYFSDLVPLTSNTFCLRAYNESLKQNILLSAREGVENDTVPRYMLEKQSDGFFCTDGMLLYNPARGEVIYVYYYRNQFVQLDSEMRVKHVGHTIDTVGRADVDVGFIRSESQMVLLNQPTVVNKHSCTDENFLYIHSGIKADNETDFEFKGNSVVDVYSLADNKYQFSFYLPFLAETSIDDFKAANHKLIVVHGQILAVYALPEYALLHSPQ